jgi:HlyD family secretion protein
VVARREDALMVPNAALRFKPEAKDSKDAKGNGEKREEKPASDKKPGKKRDASSGTVYILQGKELKPVSVSLGITDSRSTEVLGGELKAGDKVVVGENQLEENTPGKKSTVQMRMF